LPAYDDPEHGEVGLVVVAKFAPDQEEERKSARAVLDRHAVPMHTFREIEPLIKEILAHRE